MILAVVLSMYFAGWLVSARSYWRYARREEYNPAPGEAMLVALLWPLLVFVGGPLWLLAKMVTTDLPKLRHRHDPARVAELERELSDD